MTLQLTTPTSATDKGLRPYQEDRFFTASMPQGFLFGVFDGHGGAQVSHKVSEMFPGTFADAIGDFPTVEEAFLHAFATINEQTKHMNMGSSASVAFIPNSCDQVVVAVLGDSPIIVKRADGSIWIGPDHNVQSNKAEAETAKARGGFISNGYLCVTYHGPGLQMARAFGDFELRSVLSRIPEISIQPLGAESFVLVCTDGALDPGHVNTAGAAQDVAKLIQMGGEAQTIVNRAISIPTEDNVTAVLVRVENV